MTFRSLFLPSMGATCIWPDSATIALTNMLLVMRDDVTGDDFSLHRTSGPRTP